MAASVVAAVMCAAAAVWVIAGGQTAFLLSYVDIGFHELGHLVFSWVPGLFPAFAGSLVQVAVPIGLAVYFLVRRESYGSGLMFAWAATSAANVSVYAADAPFQQLSLLGNGRHDWAWILGSLGHLDWAGPIAAGIRVFAVVLALVGLAVSLWPLLTSRTKARAEARLKAERDAREAQSRARAPHHDPRNVPPAVGRRPPPPAAPAGRF
jgi:hypothetical protein